MKPSSYGTGTMPKAKQHTDDFDPQVDYVILSRVDEMRAITLNQEKYIHMWMRHNEANQRFRIRRKDKSYEIVSVLGQPLGIEDNSHDSGKSIVMANGVINEWTIENVAQSKKNLRKRGGHPQEEEEQKNLFYVRSFCGKALDLCGGDHCQNGSRVHQWDIHEDSNQQWYIIPANSYINTGVDFSPHEEFVIISKMNRWMCMTIDENAHMKVVLKVRENNKFQRFHVRRTDTGGFQLTSVLGMGIGPEGNKQNFAGIQAKEGLNSDYNLIPIKKEENCYHLISFTGLALDAKAGQINPNTEIVQWIFHSGDNQKWYIVPVSYQIPSLVFFDPPTEYIIMSAKDKNRALDVNQDPANKNMMIVWEKHGFGNQRFYIRTVNGKHFIHSLMGGMLRIASNTDAHEQIEMTYDSNNSKGEEWEIIPIDVHKRLYYIKTFCGKAMDLTAGHTEMGTRVSQFMFHGGDNQMWYIQPQK